MKLYDGATGWQTSTFDAVSKVTNQTGPRDLHHRHFYASNLNNGNVQSEYSVVGMNANKIPNIRETIRNYVNEIMNHLAQIEPLANADNAFRSQEVQQAISNYIATVKEYCVNLTSQLLAFSDKLADVEKAYQQNMEKLARHYKEMKFNSESFGGFEDQFKYKEQF